MLNFGERYDFSSVAKVALRFVCAKQSKKDIEWYLTAYVLCTLYVCATFTPSTAQATSIAHIQ